MAEKLSPTCYSDVLCVWAYSSQERVSEANIMELIRSPVAGAAS